MRLATCDLRSPQASDEARGGLGGSWVQFGDTLLLSSSDRAWSGVRSAAYSRGIEFREHPESVPKNRLHLVRQKGRLFQREHPNVPVLLDKGRYLVVDLDPEAASRFEPHEGPCYIIEPLPTNEVVFEHRAAPSPSARAPVAWVQSLVNTLTEPPLRSDLEHLASFHTRHSTRPEYDQAAAWARDQLSAMGYSVSLETITVGASSSANVVAEKTGGGSAPRRRVLVVAHLDSINVSGGSAAVAPGADDNASGSAGLLAVARALQSHPPEHDLTLVLFGGEEQGLHGSNQYLAQLTAAERDRIDAVVNMDMIGVLNTTDPTVLLEGGAVSQTVIDGLASAAADYTQLQVQTSLNPFGSDHLPFIQAGVPAALTIEGADSANTDIHTSNDTIGHIDYGLALEILRLNVAYVATTLGKTGGIQVSKLISAIPGPDLTFKLPPNWLDWIHVQYSGRYPYSGLPVLSLMSTTVRPVSTIHNLDQPITVTELPTITASLGWPWISHVMVRFTLHIDIDGTDPLGVVSGTIGGVRSFSSQGHFIGRVTSNTAATGGGRDLVVEDFAVPWPTGEMIDRLEINVSGTFLQNPVAEVHFITTGRRRFGPYTVKRESRYFRDVEIEVDREDGAIDPEPYDTHTHPDRPANLVKESLTLETAFAKAGINVTRSSGTNIINTSAAGTDNRWTYPELHDAMVNNWSAFANQPQWKMWLFFAELATSDSLGGVMFDGNIDEAGGVDRQGTALFTLSPFFHTAGGGFPQANPPAAAAAERELFFNMIHESGHAFNLYHSFAKTAASPWTPPPWMPLANDPEALSWMNYSERPSPGLSAKWFYDRFRFRFVDVENLFLRHAPERFVQMGAEDWGQNHGRAARGTLDFRLELSVRTLKKIFDLGEPITLELKLKNVGSEVLMVHDELHPHAGLVEIAITEPDGTRRPFLPFLQARHRLSQEALEPGAAKYSPVRVNIGKLGAPFKHTGAYRIEATYTNVDGGVAAAVHQLYVRPPDSYDEVPVVNELFRADVGRALYVGATRLEDEAVSRMDWVRDKLTDDHPVATHLAACRSRAYAVNFKEFSPQEKKLYLKEAEPDVVVERLQSAIAAGEATADTVGHIHYRELVDTYTHCAVAAKKAPAARKAQQAMVSLFKKREVIARVIKEAEKRLKELK